MGTKSLNRRVSIRREQGQLLTAARADQTNSIVLKIKSRWNVKTKNLLSLTSILHDSSFKLHMKDVFILNTFVLLSMD